MWGSDFVKLIKNFVHTTGDLLYYFTIYSFIGWFIETVYVYMQKGKFVKMGILAGPFSPIYGIGALLLIFLLKPVKKNTGVFFISSIFICSVLEYITGYVFRVFFNKALWDYSNELFNVNGIICLKASMFWGIAAIILIKQLHPRFMAMVSRIPLKSRETVAYALTVYFLIATIIYMLKITGYSYAEGSLFRIASYFKFYIQ